MRRDRRGLAVDRPLARDPQADIPALARRLLYRSAVPKPQGLLGDDARARIKAAIGEIEQLTSAEVVVAVHPASAAYRATEWLARFEHVALLNGLEHVPAEETAAVNAFGHALEQLLKTAAVEGLRVPAMRPPARSVLQRIPEVGALIEAATTVV